MSEAALRSLLASFVIEVDKTGELAKGNAAIDALKSRLGDLQAELNKVRAPAAAAGKAIHQAFQQGWGSVPGLADALKQQAQSKTANLFGQFGAAQGINEYASPIGPERMGAQLGPTRATLDAETKSAVQLGPTRDTLNAARTATAQADAAAAKYATTLRGRLASAVRAARDGFGRAGASGGEGGPGLIDRLATARNAFLGLAGGATVTGIKRLVDGIGDISEGAQRLGVSTDQFQRLRVLADQNNTSVEALGTAFRNLSNAAVQPTKETAAAFKTLGVSVKDDVTGQFKSANDLFFDTTAALAGVTDGTKRNALAQDLLGRSALELKPLFANGTAAVNEQRKALASLNVLSKETIDQADGVSDTWKTLPLLFEVAAEPLLKLLIPALAQLTEWVVKGTNALAKFLKQTDMVSVAITALAGVAAFKLLPSFLKLLPTLKALVELGGGWTKTLSGMAGEAAKAGLKFARLAISLLVLEDFITFLRGGDSETGRLLDAIFGEGTSEGTIKTIHDVKDALVDLWNFITGKGGGEKAKAFFQEIDDGINLIANDLLGKLGIGKGGLNGPLSVGDGHRGLVQSFLDPLNLLDLGKTKPTDMATPALPPTGFYGPPDASGSAAGNNTTFGDTNVTVTMGPSASAGDVGNSVASAVTEERNRIIGQYGGF